MLIRCFLLIAVISAFVSQALARELWCLVDKKLHDGGEFEASYIEEQRFGLIIEWHGDTARISRCDRSAPCDAYAIDHIAYTGGIMDITKFYYFRGQFDVQLFSNLRFIENNGRGGIAWGQCWDR